jgi:hypothetical protein
MCPEDAEPERGRGKREHASDKKKKKRRRRRKKKKQKKETDERGKRKGGGGAVGCCNLPKRGDAGKSGTKTRVSAFFKQVVVIRPDGKRSAGNSSVSAGASRAEMGHQLCSSAARASRWEIGLSGPRFYF